MSRTRGPIRARRGPAGGLVAVATVVAVVTLGTSSAAVATGNAKPATTYSVAPTKSSVSTIAGDTTAFDVQVSTNATPLTFNLTHVDFGLDRATYTPQFIEDGNPDTTAFSTRGWFTISPAKLSLRANTSATVHVRVHVPRNTPGGTYLGAVMVTPTAADTGDGQVHVVLRVPALAFINVAGGDKPKPRVSRFDVPRLRGDGPVPLDLRMTNDGDEYYTVSGTVQLDDGRGAGKRLTIKPSVVMAHQPRRLTRRARGESRAADDAEIGRPGLGFGRHHVVARLRIEPGGDTIVVRRTVWIIPMWVWVVLALAALAVAGAGIAIRNWLHYRAHLADERATATRPSTDPRDVDDDHDDVDSVDDEPSFDDMDDMDDSLSDDDSLHPID